MLILRDIRAGDNDIGSHNLPLCLCAGYNSLSVCSCYSKHILSVLPLCCRCGGGVFACSHTDDWRQQVQLAPLLPISALTLVGDSTEGSLFYGLLHRLVPSRLGGSWLLLLLSHSLSCCSGETAWASLCKAVPHVCTHTGLSDSLLKPAQEPSAAHPATMAGKTKMEPWPGVAPIPYLKRPKLLAGWELLLSIVLKLKCKVLTTLALALA